MVSGGLTLIHMGAEAKLYRGIYAGVDAVYKYRVPKKYRHPQLDARIRAYRTLREARALMDAGINGIPAPAVLLVEPEEALIVMEHVEGRLLGEVLEHVSGRQLEALFHMLGRIAGRMHKAGLIHGDLTTSNIIVTRDSRLVLIDFGLSSKSRRLEDRGIDVHVLLRSLESTVPEAAEHAYKSFLEGYGEEAGISIAEEIAEKVREIRMRGRYVAERRKTSLEAVLHNRE